eukprot:5815832-Prymnesium_polylepis.1
MLRPALSSGVACFWSPPLYPIDPTKPEKWLCLKLSVESSVRRRCTVQLLAVTHEVAGPMDA